MGCKSPRTLWVAGNGRYSVVPPGSILPGQDGPVHPDFGGFSGPQSKGMQSGQIITIDCRTCSSCIVKHQNALIGSCLAETEHAKHVVSITCTYGNDPGSDTRSDLAHKMLTKPHVREMMQRLVHNRALGRFRYLMAGEYGPLYGRAHWHGILIFEENMPQFDFTASRYNDNRIWPYGFIQARPVDDPAQIAYVCKYATKSTQAMKDHQGFLPGVETALMRSRIPPLGQPFFIDRAVQQAEWAVPLSMRYMPPGGVQSANYHVKGKASRLRMASAYLDQLETMGHDVTYFDWVPRGYQFTGPGIPRSPDKDICRLVEEAVRQRRLDAVPDLTPRQQLAAIKADVAERVLKQERANAVIAKRREAQAVKRAVARNDAFARSFRQSPDDPYWLDFDASRHAFDLVKSGAWRDD